MRTLRHKEVKWFAWSLKAVSGRTGSYDSRLSQITSVYDGGSEIRKQVELYLTFFLKKVVEKYVMITGDSFQNDPFIFVIRMWDEYHQLPEKIP